MSKFKFKKKYGQNFLQDESVIDKIVSSITPTALDLIIEIGPGGGALTKKLKNYECPLLAFEIDSDVEKFLNLLENEKTKIIYGDFLALDIKNIIKNYNYNDLFIVGNLPYYITTPILERIIDLELNPKEIVIMVQKEVADRFLAKPKTKEYGYMTVLLNYHYNLSRIVNVPRTSFKPAPKVDSTVIKLTRREKEKLDYVKFVKLLKDSFQFKRKTIYNNLKSYNQSILRDILQKHHYDDNVRAEELDLETFIELSQRL